MREFAQNQGGARAILPPVLHSRGTGIRRTETQENADGDEDSEPAEEEDVDDEHDTADDVEAAPIRVADFELPLDVPSPLRENTTRKYCLQRNPLAVLLSESNDIHRFYGNSDNSSQPNHKNGDYSSGTDDADEEIFVLNVAYAGNEAHESLVRVRFLANPRAVEALERALSATMAKDEGSSSPPCPWLATENLYQQYRQLIDCLTFYGYVLWKEVK